VHECSRRLERALQPSTQSQKRPSLRQCGGFEISLHKRPRASLLPPPDAQSCPDPGRLAPWHGIAWRLLAWVGRPLCLSSPHLAGCSHTHAPPRRSVPCPGEHAIEAIPFRTLLSRDFGTARSRRRLISTITSSTLSNIVHGRLPNLALSPRADRRIVSCQDARRLRRLL
jgi:hypothetical protein